MKIDLNMIMERNMLGHDYTPPYIDFRSRLDYSPPNMLMQSIDSCTLTLTYNLGQVEQVTPKTYPSLSFNYPEYMNEFIKDIGVLNESYTLA